MNRILTALILSAAAALPAGAQDDPVQALQKRVQETARKVSAAFAFFPGGSGVLISEDGWCLTNHHVISTGSTAGVENDLRETVEVTLTDAKKHSAEIRCSDAVGDIALVKLKPAEGQKFPFITLADSDKLEVGQYVLAIGAPFSIGAQSDPAPDGRHYPSVSLGIVSALHRFQQQYGDCIQTDAAVNPGNSGGPLVDLDGRLVGINGRILTRYGNRVNSGVGFAIPSNQIQNFLPKMKEGGYQRRIYHGTIPGLLLSETSSEGILRVRDTREGSVAAGAGFLSDDVVLSVNGHKVFNRKRFDGIVSTWPADSEVTVKVQRAEKTVDVKVRLESAIQTTITGGRQLPPPKGKASTGATFEDGKAGQDGTVTVTAIVAKSPADEGGLKPGDVVLQLEGERVKSSKSILDLVRTRKPGDTVTFRVLRGTEELDLKVKLGLQEPSEE